MKKLLPFLILLSLSFFAVKPLLHAGFFPMHDAAQPERVFAMWHSLQVGMFPVRWVSYFGYGYGYPLFNFYAPFSYYIGALFLLLHFDVLMATKLMVSLGIICSGIFMYLFAKEFWGKAGGIISALLYMYAPYHAIDLYVRGDFAESWGYALVPLVFLGFYKLHKMQQSVWKSITLGSFALAAIILSHNLTAMMVIPFLFGFTCLVIFSIHNKILPTVYYILFTTIFGLLIAAFYWIPVFTEMQYTNVLSQTGGGFDFHQHFVCFQQLWTSPWGYGGSAPGCDSDGLSFMIGKLHILFAVSALFVSFFLSKKDKNKYVIWISAMLLIIAVLLTTAVSKPIWEIMKPMAFFQFPWRFLLLIAFFTSFLSGASIYYIEKNKKMPQYIGFTLAIVCIPVIIFFNMKFFIPKDFYPVNPNYFTQPAIASWELSQDAHEYMPKDFIVPKSKSALPKEIFTSPNGKIISQQGNTAIIFVDKQPTIVHINIAYFPAWHVFVNNSEVHIKKVSNGMDILLLPGKNIVQSRFIQTPIEKAANIVSLASILSLFIGIIFTANEKNNC